MCFELHNPTSVYSQNIQNTGWRYERFGCIWLHHVLHPRRFVVYSIRGTTTSCRSHANCIAHITCMEWTSCLLYMATEMTVWYQSDNVWHPTLKDPSTAYQRLPVTKRVFFRPFVAPEMPFTLWRGLCRHKADSQWDGGRWSTKSFKDSEVRCVGCVRSDVG